MGVFGDLNKVEIIGNMTQDAELRYTTGGSGVVNFSVATNRSFKQGEEWQDEVTYHNVVVWGNDAQMLAQRAGKGTRVYIQGRIQTRSWDDQNGQKQYKTEIVAERVILLDRYKKLENEGGAGGGYTPKSSGGGSGDFIAKAPGKSAPKPKQSDDDIIDPDDLPF